MPTNLLTGQLTIRLRWRQGKVTAVHICSSRLRLGTRFFAGKPVDSAPKLVGMLFSLCGTAQSVASARACEQALGQQASPEAEQQRDFQIRVEALFEHLLRLSQDWNTALGCELPAPAELHTLFKLKRELLQATDPQPVLAEIRQWLETHLLGMPTSEWQEYCCIGDVNKLVSSGKIGNLVSVLQARGWDSLGDTPIHLLPELAADWWQQRLASADAENFMAEPDVDGQACETSALTRQWGNPGLQVWRERYGNGLITRLVARVLDMLYSLHTPLEREWPGSGGTPQAGISLLQTARGLLAHRVTQQSGLIRDYQIVAPTEWNFHPRGSLQNMLATLQGKDEADLSQQARILITALDPCVDYQLEIIPDA
ncbi:MAG: nickel-dependent hydrogenase large subunit [Thiothrix sp.]